MERRIGQNDRTLVLGSCFAANIGERMKAAGYEVCLNPFGTIFNPASILNALERLDCGRPFTADEVVRLGAGSELYGSFSHYTKFARETPEEFLQNANASLEAAAEFWHNCGKVIVTFGTAFVFHRTGGPVTLAATDAPASSADIALPFPDVVTNCLKRPAREFDRRMMTIDDITGSWSRWFDAHPDAAAKDWIFTVSPVRHLADGAHGNNLSKATLLLAQESIISADPKRREYFPAYEILLDELRDYSWYASDKVHPGEGAVEMIWQRFKEKFL